MIEIICNGDDESKGEKTGTAKSIRMPKNIKQIGDVNSDKKIYIEDYAFTYINSLAYGAQDEEQAGVLLGEYQKSDEEKCIFIKGVIKAKPEEGEPKQGVIFDEKIWSKIYTEIEKYFPNLQVVGWFATMSDVTMERMQYLRRVHLDNFAGDMKVMYVVNTSEKEENFYFYENGDLRKQSGYVCFYERNYEMQEYMMEKRGRQSVESPEKDKVMRSIRTIIQEKEEQKQQKKTGSMMYSVSALMVVVILVLGINLINNHEKMNRLDKSLTDITKEISTMGGNYVEKDKEDVVEVNKIAGNVFPTQAVAETVASNTVAETEGTEKTTEKSTEKVAEKATEKSTEKATEKATGVAVVSAKTHVVAKGETLSNICLKYYGTVAKAGVVAKYNNMDDADKLYVGQVIKLP